MNSELMDEKMDGIAAEKQIAVGPNGGSIGYMPNGDMVEWVQGKDENGMPAEVPLLLRRNDTDIKAAYREFHVKVWWYRHHIRLRQIESNRESVTEDRKRLLEEAKKAARRIELKYGKTNLPCDAFEWGLACGRLSSLSWVLGSEWGESLDTK